MRAQLPSIQLDAVTETAEPVVVANRNPQPGEVQIPLNAHIAFDLFVSPTDLQLAEVSVDGHVVVEGGSFDAAWNVIIATVPGGYRFSMFPPAPFLSDVVVHVAVRIGVLEAFWAFNTLDTAPPSARSVVAINKDQLKVTFSEPVTMGNALAPIVGDALSPLSYMIEYRSRPATTPSVVKVEYSSPSEVILTTDFELSFGAQYTLVVSGVSDEFGNVFLPPNNVREFTAFMPPYPDGRRWLLHDFVPRMALAIDNGDLALFLGCLQDTNNILLHSIDRWLEIIDPDTAPEDFVDAMLVDLGNPFEFPLTLSQKRRLSKALMLIYRLKGTDVGIAAVVRFFVGVEVWIETFVGRGWIIGHHQLSTSTQVAPNPAIIGPNQHALYCFRVHSFVQLTDSQREYIRTIALYMKGAQEHLIGIRDRPLPPKDIWWTVGITRIGFVRIFGEAGPPVVPPPPGPMITSFTLSDTPPF